MDLKFGTFSSSMKNFLTQGAIQPPIIYSNIKTKIGPEIGHFQVAKCKIFIGKAGHKTNLDLKKGPELSILCELTKCKIFLRKDACKLQKSCTYAFRLKKGLLKIKHF